METRERNNELPNVTRDCQLRLRDFERAHVEVLYAPGSYKVRSRHSNVARHALSSSNSLGHHDLSINFGQEIGELRYVLVLDQLRPNRFKEPFRFIELAKPPFHER